MLAASSLFFNWWQFFLQDLFYTIILTVSTGFVLAAAWAHTKYSRNEPQNNQKQFPTANDFYFTMAFKLLQRAFLAHTK